MHLKPMKHIFALAAATMLAFGVQATDYYWIGESTEWANGDNWSLTAGSSDPAGAYPGASDTATFSSDAAITLTADQPVSGLVLNATLTLSGSATYGLTSLQTMSGTGKLSLNDSGITNLKTVDLTIPATIELNVVGANKNWIVGRGNYSGSKSYKAHFIDVYAPLTGDGILEIDQADCRESGVRLYGDNSEFAGTATLFVRSLNSCYRGPTTFMTASSGSAKASWIVSGGFDESCGIGRVGFTGDTIRFGSLNGKFRMVGTSSSGVVFEIGHLGKDDVLKPVCSGSTGAYRDTGTQITKVGTGTLTIDSNDGQRVCVRRYIAKGGVLKLVGPSNLLYYQKGSSWSYANIAYEGGTVTMDETLTNPQDTTKLMDLSARINESSSPVSFSNDIDIVWATALTVAKVPGLTKKGTGTLTLSATPTYTGATTVEGGTLALPKDVTLGGALCANGGKIGLYGELSGNEETLFTWTTAGSSVTLDSFDIPIEAPFLLDFESEDTTTSLVVKRQVNAYAWTGADDNRWENAKNWLVNGEATEYYPGANDTVVIALENQTIAITPSVEFGTFQTLADTTTFAILFSNEGDTYTIPTDKVAADKFSVAQPFTASAVLSEGVYTAGVRTSATYTWGGKDGAWSDATSWRIAGKATGVYPIMAKTYADEDGTADSATFESSTTVTLTENAKISTLTIADSVRVEFSSDVAGTLRDLQVLEYGCGVSSTMALAYINLFPLQNQTAAKTLTVGGYVEIVDDTTNGIYATSWRVDGSNKPTSALVLAGNLTGGGALTVGANNGQSRGYFSFSGDNSAFAGTILATHKSTDAVYWNNENTGSANAEWNLSQQDGKSLKICSAAGTTNKFGRLISNGVTLENTNGAILEIGALGGESTLDLASGTFDVIKVGAGNLTIDGNQTGSVTIEAGTVTMGSADASLTSNSRAINFAGGALVNAYGTDVSPYIANCATTTSAIVINDCGVDAVWATALPVAAQGGFTKQGAGMLTLTEVPKYTGKTTVEGGLLRIPAGTVIDTLDVKNGATIDLYTTGSFAEATPVFTISNVVEGVDLATAIPNRATTSYTFEQDTETGVWTVKAVRAPAIFTWTGAVDSSWENAGNWLVNGGAVLAAPTPVDTVLFPAKDEGNWNVTVAIDTHIVGMANNAPVTLTGEGDIYLGSISSELEDAPALTLGDNATIRSENQLNAVLTIDVPLNIAASAEYPAGVYGRWMKDSGGNATLNINRELLGDGYVEMKQSRGGIFFNGTNTAFAGTLTVFDDSAKEISGGLRTAPQFVLPESTSANAVWNINNYSSLLQDGGKTYCFGGLSGYVTLNTTQSNYKLNTLEIGARDDVDSVLAGNFFANSYINLVDGRGNTIRKVGNSTLTTTAVHVRAYELNGGLTVLNHNRAVHTRWNGEKTEVTDEAAEAEHCYDIPISFGGGVLALGDDVIVDPSTNIVNSTDPIAFSNATDRVWASPLAASNQRHKIVKKGAGTLTLSEKPDWSSVTVEVDAGIVVMPKGIVYRCGKHTVVEEGEETITFTYGERVKTGTMFFLK